MLTDIQRPVSGSVVKSIWRSVAGAYAPPEVVFPDKLFYFNDFTSIANGTLLRNLPGWAAYNSASATTIERDQWTIQSGAATRSVSNADFAASPGKFVVGYDSGSTDVVMRMTIPTLPASGTAIRIPVCATAENNILYFGCVNSGGVMGDYVLAKRVGAVVTNLMGQPPATSLLGRPLIAGDTIDIRVLARRIHLFISGTRITATDGIDIDTGGVFAKGTVCGFGTGGALGCAIDNVYIAPIAASLTVANTIPFWSALIGSSGRIAPFSGTYAGDVQALDYQVVNSQTAAIIKPWARVSGATIGSGSWTASVLIPMGDLVTNPKCRVQFRAANDVDSVVQTNETACGITVGIYGQSNAEFRSYDGATSYPVSAASYIFTRSVDNSWIGGTTATTSNRARIISSKLAIASGIPCGVLIGGTSGKHIYELNRRGVGEFWLDELETGVTTAKANGFIQNWLWVQGEAESSDAGLTDVDAYRSEFDLLLSELSTIGAAGGAVRVGVCNLSSYGGVHTSGQTIGDRNWSVMRSILAGLGDKTGTYLSTGMHDLSRVDDYHLTPDSFVESGRRVALSIAKDLGFGAYDGRGPVVDSASRVGAVVTLAVNLNGATSLSGTGLTNYQVSANDFASNLTISSSVVSGGNIVLTLSSDPGVPVKVRSFYGMDWVTPVRAIGTYADGTTIAVEPLFNAINVA
jgi:hypothetical protein